MNQGKRAIRGGQVCSACTIDVHTRARSGPSSYEFRVFYMMVLRLEKLVGTSTQRTNSRATACSRKHARTARNRTESTATNEQTGGPQATNGRAEGGQADRWTGAWKMRLR